MRVYVILFLLFAIVVSCGDNTNSTEATSYENLSDSDKEAMVQKGNVLFSTNCKICHSLDEKATVTLGPILDSIAHHWPDKSVLNAYIKNAPAMMQQNKRSKKVYQEWRDKPQMPAFTGLSIDEIDCIIEFLYTKS